MLPNCIDSIKKNYLIVAKAKAKIQMIKSNRTPPRLDATIMI